MEMAHRKLEFVKTELQGVTLERNLEDAVSRILIVAGVVGQRVGRFGARNAVGAGFRPCFRACFLAGQPLLKSALAPRRLVHPEKPLVHIVTDDVVQRGAVIADHQNDHADLVVGQERNLRVKAREIAAMISNQMPAIGCGLAPHAIGRIE